MIYLTYQNWACNDGLGAQLQRIITIYQTARFYDIGYIHSPILDIENQGVAALEKESHDASEMVKKANVYFKLVSDTCDHFDVKENVDFFKKELLSKKVDDSKTYLYSLKFGHYANEHTQVLNIPTTFPWLKKEIGSIIYIGCHVRRGDVTVQETMRLLPNSFYINCLKYLTLLLDFLNISYEVHIFTESVTKDISVDDAHPIFKASLRGSAIIKPADDLDEFLAIKNSTLHVNGCAVDSIISLANADILLGSKSSFSYVAGLINKKGIKIFHPFWCTLPKDWISASSSEELAKHVNIIQSILVEKTEIDLQLFRKPITATSGVEGIIVKLFDLIGITNKRFYSICDNEHSYTHFLKLFDYTGVAAENMVANTNDKYDLLIIHKRDNYQQLTTMKTAPRIILTNFNILIPPGYDRVLVDTAHTAPELDGSSITSIKMLLNSKGYSLMATCENEAVFLRNDLVDPFTWKDRDNECALIDATFLEFMTTTFIKSEFDPPHFIPSSFL